jgi:hypothetical protein
LQREAGHTGPSIEHAPEVFLAYAGEESMQIAKVLGDWLQQIFPHISPRILGAGFRPTRSEWFSDVRSGIGGASIGIACITESNKNSAWLLFETGALWGRSVSLSGGSTPLFFALYVDTPRPSSGPLHYIYTVSLTSLDMLVMLETIRTALPIACDGRGLEALFRTSWHQLEANIRKILQPLQGIGAQRYVRFSFERQAGAICLHPSPAQEA